MVYSKIDFRLSPCIHSLLYVCTFCKFCTLCNIYTATFAPYLLPNENKLNQPQSQSQSQSKLID